MKPIKKSIPDCVNSQEILMAAHDDHGDRHAVAAVVAVDMEAVVVDTVVRVEEVVEIDSSHMDANFF